MNGFYKNLLTAMVPKLSVLVSNDTPIDATLYSQSRTLDAWCDLLSFGRWLHLCESVPLFGKRLVRKIVPVISAHPAAIGINTKLPEFCAGNLAILLEEWHLCPESDRLAHLDIVVATYVSFGQIPGSSGRCSSLFFAMSNL